MSKLQRKRKAKHTSIRWQGNAWQVLERRAKVSGMAISEIVHELVLYADAVQSSKERMSGTLDSPKDKAGK